MDSQYPTLPREMIKFAAQCDAALAEYENLFSGIESLASIPDWLKEIREIIGEMSGLLEDLDDTDARSEICAELEELFVALEDTVSCNPAFHSRPQKAAISDDLSELIRRVCERIQEIAYSFHSRIQDAHLW
jgi:hypothetical protein